MSTKNLKYNILQTAFGHNAPITIGKRAVDRGATTSARRIAAGIEHIDYIIADLQQAFDKINKKLNGAQAL